MYGSCSLNKYSVSASVSLEHILMSKTMQHLLEHNILVKSQHGWSCETQLIPFIRDLYENLDGADDKGPHYHGLCQGFR